MNADQLIDSKMMVSAEFGTRGIPKVPTVTIAGVTREAQDKEGKEVWAILTFAEPFAKPLKMNRHSQKCCIAMFGKETDNWIGKRLTLYAKDGTYFGERGTAVRIQGSPDLAAPISVEVKKRGGGRTKPDVYNLVPTGAQPARQAAPAPAAAAPAPAAAAPPKNEAPKAATPPAADQPKPSSPAPAAATDQNQAKPQEPPASSAPASGSPPDPAPPPKTPPPPPNDQPDPKFLGPTFAFGPHKGKSIEHASKPDILATVGLGETQLLENKELTAGQQKSVQAGIDACRRELERRFKMGNATPPPPPEPGSDG